MGKTVRTQDGRKGLSRTRGVGECDRCYSEEGGEQRLGALKMPYDIRPPLPQEKSLVLISRGSVDLRTHGFVGGSRGKNLQ